MRCSRDPRRKYSCSDKDFLGRVAMTQARKETNSIFKKCLKRKTLFHNNLNCLQNENSSENIKMFSRK